MTVIAISQQDSNAVRAATVELLPSPQKASDTGIANPSQRGEPLVALTPKPDRISVDIEPSQVTLFAAGKQHFTVHVKGAPGSVTWSLRGDGELGEVSSGGDYSAPAVITQSKVLQIVATSTVDNSRSGTAKITLEVADTPSADGKQF